MKIFMKTFWHVKEVPSLRLCKQLKKLGFPQDAKGWYWVKYCKKPILVYYIGKYSDNNRVTLFYYPVTQSHMGIPEKKIICKAPTVVEIMNRLPQGILKHGTDIDYYLTVDRLYVYYLSLSNEYCFKTERKMLPNRLAETYIWLKENKYIGCSPQNKKEISKSIKCKLDMIKRKFRHVL